MKRKSRPILKNILLSSILLGAAACKSDTEEVTEEVTFPAVVLKESYTVDRLKLLNVNPKIEGKLTWSINDSVISDHLQLDFVSSHVKTYPLTLKVEMKGAVKTYQSSIIVNKEQIPYSKYISNVFDFRPATGQFINEIPEYVNGNTEADMIKKAKESLVGENSTMITLGGFGGYVAFGFDHTIPNLEGRDFKILGNAFWGNSANTTRSGSCEPGIIMVGYDKNKNGKPDEDEWYEIAGSEYFKNSTTKNYTITYFKPNENKSPVPGSEFWQTDVEYIKWQDNFGNSGFKTKNTFHTQSYYPLWLSGASYSLTGTRLKDNFYDQSGTGAYWVGTSYDYGYADNAPNNDEASNIDISWAVDRNGNYVKLPGIDFIKVYTGINQEAGWLGEVSTEVAGAYDLHLK
ncbi:cell surface protein [Chryseobacterium oranimense]|uniref:cell surface protein n=1 Tax=Chryseobacterium oranimense TaxID=421058 RepID=UPI0021AFEA2B|nr:cell surface protein [Chryseobacterium oranimense]UWX59459.1 cell surface protein [Chryseobacterium oranimense]